MKETLWNGIMMKQGPFRLGTDSVLLSHFLTLPPKARVADLGAGCGTIGLLLSARDRSCTVTGIELDETAWSLGQENIALNGLETVKLLQGDVRQIRELLPVGSFDCVVSNPPYFPVGSGKAANAYRSELTLNLRELCAAADWLLPTGGRFALVHRPERLCDLIWELRSHRIEPKRIQFVRHNAQAPVCLVLIEGRKNAGAGLQYLPDLIEFHPDGTETEEYRAAYHRGETP
jgi:tRNA1Val (adenine37-N6)-methyltransferase